MGAVYNRKLFAMTPFRQNSFTKLRIIPGEHEIASIFSDERKSQIRCEVFAPGDLGLIGGLGQTIGIRGRNFIFFLQCRKGVVAEE